MKKIHILLAIIAAMVSLVSCNDFETYAELRDKENAAINRFISDSTITVISEAQFEVQGNKTNVAKNEYVLFESTGVYMQIVREGCGEKIKPGETAEVLCRFSEYNILGDSLQLTNNNYFYASRPEKMTVKNTSGTFTGVFDSSSSLMSQIYNSTAVPGGWLIPMRYVKIGRQSKPDEELARVKLIVPSSQGQSSASASTYPCFYDLVLERGR